MIVYNVLVCFFLCNKIVFSISKAEDDIRSINVFNDFQELIKIVNFTGCKYTFNIENNTEYPVKIFSFVIAHDLPFKTTEDNALLSNCGMYNNCDATGFYSLVYDNFLALIQAIG